MSAVRSDERINFRVSKDVKTKLDRAASLLGLKRTEYVVRVMEENAAQVIAEHGKITLDNDVFDSFVRACEATYQPNTSLRAAKKRYDQAGME